MMLEFATFRTLQNALIWLHSKCEFVKYNVYILEIGGFINIMLKQIKPDIFSFPR